MLRHLQENNMQTYYRMPLEELCAQVIGMARGLINGFPLNEVSVDSRERGSLYRVLQNMRVYGGLNREDDTDVDVLTAVLQREIERETRGWQMVFDGHHDPEIGAVGESRAVRELTERGRIVDEQARSLRLFSRARAICRARMDAEKILMRR